MQLLNQGTTLPGLRASVAAWGLHAEFIKDSQARLGSTGAWRRGRKKTQMPWAASDYLPAIKNKIGENRSGRVKAPSSGSCKETAASLVLLCVLGLESPRDHGCDEWPP